MERFLVTHSLLSSWLYAISDDPYSDATNEKDPLADFLTVLRREPTETTEAMQNGIDFENLVTAIADGERFCPCTILDAELNASVRIDQPITEHPWYSGAKQIADIVQNGIFQYVAKRDAVIGGRNVLLYGRLDALKAGHIYDIKFSRRYEVGKFYDSTQHPMYLNLVPEALDFTYLVFNGSSVWQERYSRKDTMPIEPVVEHFFEWLRGQGLDDLYRENWGAK